MARPCACAVHTLSGAKWETDGSNEGPSVCLQSLLAGPVAADSNTELLTGGRHTHYGKFAVTSIIDLCHSFNCKHSRLHYRQIKTANIY